VEIVHSRLTLDLKTFAVGEAAVLETSRTFRGKISMNNGELATGVSVHISS